MICPAEQTCIIDDEIYDEMIAEFERMGARMLSPEEAAKITEFAFGCGDKVSMDAVGQRRRSWPPARVSAFRPAPRSCSRRCPRISTNSPSTHWCRRS